MKIQTTSQNAPIVQAFLKKWVSDDKYILALWSLDECEPIYLDCDATELSNCFIELEKKGFCESIKKIFTGDHFYRSDTGKCPRCWRHRAEIHWNNENLKDVDAAVCDRCFCFLHQVEVAA